MIMMMVLIPLCWSEDEVLHLHCKVDLVITLGGDGTVLWVNFHSNHFFFRKVFEYIYHSQILECMVDLYFLFGLLVLCTKIPVDFMFS